MATIVLTLDDMVNASARWGRALASRALLRITGFASQIFQAALITGANSRRGE
jgi:hypothetical protein